MLNLRLLKHTDWILWFAAFSLLLIGCLSIFSATSSIENRLAAESFLFLKKHLMSLLLAVFSMLILLYFDYGHLKKIAIPLYFIMAGILLIVLFMGYTTLGAQRWISFGPFSFQPSEISKILMIIFLANYLKDKKGKIQHLFDIVPLFLMITIPFLLIFKQPDLGTGLVFIFIFLAMLIWAQASPTLLILFISPFFSVLFRPIFILWIIYIVCLVLALYLARIDPIEFWLIVAINIGVGLAFPYIWHMLKPYQKQRIITFLNPAADPLGAGYHSLQSMIAIGGGGFLGKGFLQGSQTQMQFIPIQQSDFIFSVIGEEFGLWGAAIVLALFSIIILRAFRIAQEAKDFFGSLIAAGIASFFLFHFFVNIGMTLGILPIVGIPLPFVSYGGTSLLTSFICLALLQNICMRRDKLFF